MLDTYPEIIKSEIVDRYANANALNVYNYYNFIYITFKKFILLNNKCYVSIKRVYFDYKFWFFFLKDGEYKL